MMRFSLLQELRDIRPVLKRFPLSCVMTVLATLTALYAIETDWDDSGWLFQTLVSLIFIFFTSIGATLLGEAHSAKKRLIEAIGFLVSLAVLTVFFLIDAYEPRSGLLLLLGFFSMLLVPFLGPQSPDRRGLTPFIRVIERKVIFVTFSGFLLFLGANLLINAVFFLITGTSRMQWDYTEHIWVIIALFIAPMLAMSGIPQQPSTQEKPLKIQAFLLSKIITPFVLGYAAVILAYALKILILMHLPEGEIANMTAPFILVAGYLLILSADMGDEHRGIRFFQRFFPVILAPAVILLSISLSVRVEAYAITEDRYLLLAIIVVGVAAIILHLAHRKQMMRAAFHSMVVLCVTLMVATISPVNMTSLSSWSQAERLRSILTPYGLVNEERKLTPATGEENWKEGDLEEIGNLLTYLNSEMRRDHLNAMIANVSDEASTQTDGAVGHLNIPVQTLIDHTTSYFSFPHRSDRSLAVAVSEYDYAFLFDFDYQSLSKTMPYPDGSDRSITLSFDGDQAVIDGYPIEAGLFFDVNALESVEKPSDLTLDLTLPDGRTGRLILMDMNADLRDGNLVTIRTLKTMLLLSNP